ETARRSAHWADGLATINQPVETLSKVIDAFRSGGGEGKPVHLQVHISFAPSEAEANQNAMDQWRSNALSSIVASELSTPEMFDAATENLTLGDLASSVLISADLSRHCSWIAQFLDLGVDRIILHNVGRNQRLFVETFGANVLPQFD